MFRKKKTAAGIDLARLADYLPDNPVIVEAGAADGADVVALANLFPAGHVYAFEPEPETFQQLQTRVAGLPNVSCWETALAAADGEAVLHVSSGAYGTTSSSLLTPKEHLREMPDVKFQTETTVRQTTLSSWAEAAGVSHVDAFCFDMQGMEHAVIAASPQLVRDATVVVAEVFTNEKFEGCATVTELTGLLASLGFVVMETNMFWHNSGDLLAVSRRWFG